jgi:hypothetical protein
MKDANELGRPLQSRTSNPTQNKELKQKTKTLKRTGTKMTTTQENSLHKPKKQQQYIQKASRISQPSSKDQRLLS